jgi:lipopolysaccharide export system permease protein
VIAFAVIVAALLTWLSLAVAPDSMSRVLNLRNVAVRAGQFSSVAPGRFRSFGGGSAVVYAQSTNKDGTLSNVFVERSHEGNVEVAVAVRGRHSVTPDGRTLTITLYDGERMKGTPGSPQFQIMRFAEHTIPVDIPPPPGTITDLDAAPTRELLRSSDPKKQAELQWRLALPVMCLLLAIIALPLSRLRPRQGRFARVWLAVLLYVFYSNLMAAGRIGIEQGRSPGYVGLWWVHAAVALVAALVIAAPGWLARLRHRNVRT